MCPEGDAARPEAPIDHLTVSFNRPIDPATFTRDDNAFRYVSTDTQETCRRFRAFFHSQDQYTSDLYLWTEDAPTPIHSLIIAGASETIYGIDGKRYAPRQELPARRLHYAPPLGSS